MANTQEHGSEVARLLNQIQEEFEAAQRGFSGLAHGLSKHQFITQKMENMGKLHEELQLLIGDEPAIALVAEQLNALPETKSSSL